MNEKDATIQIKKIEKKYSHLIIHNQKNFWPLLRLLLYFEITKSKNFKKSKISKINYFSSFKNTYKNINSFYDLKSKIKKKENIFFSRFNYLTKVKKNNLYYDRIYDGFLDNKKIYNNSLKVYIAYNDINKKLAFNSSRTYPYLNFIKSEEILIDNKLKKVINKISVENKLGKNFLKDFISKLKIFYSWYNHGIKLFENNSYIKRIFIACWYTPDAMGLIAAAKKFNILTFDMQHGIQGKYRPMYTDWTNIQKEGYELLPNYFCCWNKDTKINILTSSKKRTDNIPKVIGNSWINLYEKKLKIKKSINNKRVILFCLQPQTSTNDIVIPKFIKTFIDSDTFKKDIFIFRFHPNDLSNKDEVKNFINNHKKQSQLKIDTGEFYIFDALNYCTHHITAWSTTALEASYFKKNSAVFGQDAKVVFKKYIKKNYIKWLNGSNKSLIKWISKNRYSKQKAISKKELYSDKINKQVFLL